MLHDLGRWAGELLLQIAAEFVLAFICAAALLLWHLPEKGRLLVHLMLYAFLGMVAAGLTLVVLPHHLIQDPRWRLFNLATTPILTTGSCGR